MSKLDEILQEWKNDSRIDSSEPGRELLNIPILHGKYLNYLSSHKLRLKDVEIKLSKTKKLKWEYYTGKMSDETLKELNLKPFPYVLKSDLTLYLDSDDDICKLKATKAVLEEIVDTCTLIIKELNSRTYQLKAYIDYEKFIQGVG